jgi:predicted nuclease of predicted toxin-antitoxin system
MQFLANENFPLASVRLLRAAGHDIVAIINDAPGIKDPEVLARAAREQRIILTFDRDYGELIYRFGQTAPLGIIYFRFDPLSPEEPAEHLLQLLTVDGLSLERRFTVTERGQVRQHPLP